MNKNSQNTELKKLILQNLQVFHSFCEEQWKTILNGVNIQRLMNNPVKIDIMPTINDFLW